MCRGLAFAVTLLAVLTFGALPLGAAEKECKAGDRIKVVGGPASVKVGTKVITTVEEGTELTASKVEDPWVKVTLGKGSLVYTGWIHKRQLVLVPAEAPTKPAASPPGKEEAKKLLGTWQCLSRVDDGKQEAEDEVKKLTWIIRAGGYFKLLREGRIVAEGVQMDVDPTKTPKTLHQWILEGENTKVYPGIYRLDADSLEVCTAPPGDKAGPTELASKPGSTRVHTVWKRVAQATDLEADPPATWWIRHMMLRSFTGAKELGSPPKRPSPERVARRAMVLALMHYRASMEQFPGDAQFEAFHGRLPTWVEQLALAPELEKQEHDFLRVPLGKADRQVAMDAGWRLEGLAVLAWALRRLDLPAYDNEVDPRKAVASVGLTDELLSGMDTAAAKRLFREAELRPAWEIDQLACHITIVHWRLRTYRLATKRMPFIGYLRAHPSFKENWLTGLRLVGDDLAIEDKAIGDAPPDAVSQCTSIVMERHNAAHWLQGDHEVYSKVDTGTMLFGLE